MSGTHLWGSCFHLYWNFDFESIWAYILINNLSGRTEILILTSYHKVEKISVRVSSTKISKIFAVDKAKGRSWDNHSNTETYKP